MSDRTCSLNYKALAPYHVSHLRRGRNDRIIIHFGLHHGLVLVLIVIKFINRVIVLI